MWLMAGCITLITYIVQDPPSYHIPNYTTNVQPQFSRQISLRQIQTWTMFMLKVALTEIFTLKVQCVGFVCVVYPQNVPFIYIYILYIYTEGAGPSCCTVSTVAQKSQTKHWL